MRVSVRDNGYVGVANIGVREEFDLIKELQEWEIDVGEPIFEGNTTFYPIRFDVVYENIEGNGRKPTPVFMIIKDTKNTGDYAISLLSVGGNPRAVEVMGNRMIAVLGLDGKVDITPEMRKQTEEELFFLIDKYLNHRL